MIWNNHKILIFIYLKYLFIHNYFFIHNYLFIHNYFFIHIYLFIHNYFFIHNYLFIHNYFFIHIYLFIHNYFFIHIYLFVIIFLFIITYLFIIIYLSVFILLKQTTNLASVCSELFGFLPKKAILYLLLFSIFIVIFWFPFFLQPNREVISISSAWFSSAIKRWN